MTDERGRVPTTEQLLEAWRAAAAAHPPGHDLADVADRIHEATPPWDLVGLTADAVQGTTAVLDLGGADVEPDGFALVRHEADAPGRLPFPERCVDAVLDRRGTYDADEVARVLRPGGVLLTEQAAGDDAVDLHAVLGSPLPAPHRTPDRAAAALLDAGLRVTHEEAWRGPISFDDVGALVAYLTATDWPTPGGFAVDGYANTLLYLHMRGPAWGQSLVFTRSRFFVRAERPA